MGLPGASDPPSSGTASRRLFFALALPDSARAAALTWRARVLRAGHGGLRLIRPSDLHITLVFLGGVPADRVAEAERILRAGAIGPVPSFVPVAYRETRHAGVIGLREAGGDDGVPPGARLAARLAAGACDAGLCRPDGRAWVPHVTIWRFERPPRLVLPPVGLPPFETPSVVLYESHQTPGGARYVALATSMLLP